MKKYRYIDSLRGFAILGVVFIHSAVHGSFDFVPGYMIKLAYSGQYGVALFFVVSAFTLFHSLNHRHTTDQTNYPSFLLRRFFRIAPMYYAGILYYSFDRYLGFRVLLGQGIREEVPTSALVSNIFFANGFDPFWINGIVPGGWTIAVEMWFYLLVPLLFLLIKSLKHALIFLGISLVIAFGLQMLFMKSSAWNDQWFYMSLLSQLPVFALGFIAYFIIRKDYKTMPSWLLLILFFVTFCLAYWATYYLVYALSFVLLMLTLKGKAYRFFVNRITVFLGRISYSMYILHFAVIFWFDKLKIMNILTVTDSTSAIVNLLIRYVLVTFITAAFAFITFKLIELPFQQLGVKLVAKLNGTRGRFAKTA